MTPQDLVREIKHFSINDKISLIEQVSQSLLTDLKLASEKSRISEKKQISVAEKIEIVESLYGFAAIKDQPAPNDEEIKEDRVNYLLEKYL